MSYRDDIYVRVKVLGNLFASKDIDEAHLYKGYVNCAYDLVDVLGCVEDAGIVMQMIPAQYVEEHLLRQLQGDPGMAHEAQAVAAAMISSGLVGKKDVLPTQPPARA